MLEKALWDPDSLEYQIAVTLLMAVLEKDKQEVWFHCLEYPIASTQYICLRSVLYCCFNEGMRVFPIHLLFWNIFFLLLKEN